MYLNIEETFLKQNDETCYTIQFTHQGKVVVAIEFQKIDIRARNLTILIETGLITVKELIKKNKNPKWYIPKRKTPEFVKQILNSQKEK